MSIGENIRKFRQAYNMEQKDLADKINVSYKTVSSWECGRTEPKMGMIEEIAKVFEVPKSDLIEGKIYKSFDTPAEFEKAWHDAGGGRHPLTLSNEEYSLILSYRIADDVDRRAIKRILNIEEERKKDDLHA